MNKISNKRVRKIVLDKYGGKCAYCGCELKERFTIDHIEPKLRGMWYSKRVPGDDVLSNYNPSCHSCNSSKGSLTLEQFREMVADKIRQLNSDYSTYRTAKRFGLVEEINKKVEFYCERYD